MQQKILLLVFSLAFFRTQVQAQTLQLFKVDEADAWVSHLHYFHPVTFSHDRIIHSYLNNKLASTSTESFGDVKIKTYSTGGVLLEQENSLNDSLFITKTILKANGEKIILGNMYAHLALYDSDITHTPAGPDGFQSFILHLDALNQTLHVETFSPVSDMALDETTNRLYFVEQYAYEEANVYALDLSTGNKNIIATIHQARAHPRILKTADYIYIAGASITFGIEINGHLESTVFPYATFVIQLDNNGTFNWIKIIKDETTPHMDLAAAPAQGVYLCADLISEVAVGSDTLEGPNWGGDFLLTRIDASGNFLWATEAPNNTLCGYVLGPGFCLDSDSNYNVYVAGSSRALLQWDDGLTIGRDTNISVPAMLIYNKDGAVVNHLVAAAGEESNFISVDVEANGDFVVSGKIYNSLRFDETTETVTDGGYHPYFLYYKSLVTAAATLPVNGSQFKIYPNPVRENSVLTIQKTTADVSVIEVYNVSGHKVMENKIEGRTGSMLLNGLQPGLYFVRINGEQVHKLEVF